MVLTFTLCSSGFVFVFMVSGVLVVCGFICLKVYPLLFLFLCPILCVGLFLFLGVVFLFSCSLIFSSSAFVLFVLILLFVFFFFFHYPAPTQIYTFSLLFVLSICYVVLYYYTGISYSVFCLPLPLGVHRASR